MQVEVLPDSRARTPKGIIYGPRGEEWVPLTCISCPAHGGYSLRTDLGPTFYSWACESCAVKYRDDTSKMVIPDEVHWKKVQEAQVEEFGRVLSDHEQLVALEDPNHILSKLLKDKEKR